MATFKNINKKVVCSDLHYFRSFNFHHFFLYQFFLLESLILGDCFSFLSSSSSLSFLDYSGGRGGSSNDLGNFFGSSSLSSASSSLSDSESSDIEISIFDDLESFSFFSNYSCEKLWCEYAPKTVFRNKNKHLNNHNRQLNDYGRLDGNNDFESDYYEEENDNYDYNSFGSSSKGFWLNPPPDDIAFMPPPPMPPSFMSTLENESLKDFIISEDPDEGYRCNFCKLFSDPNVYPNMDSDDSSMFPSSSLANKQNESFISSFYLMIFTVVIVCAIIFLVALIRYKKYVTIVFI